MISLKFSLEANWYVFESETDTEVISHFLYGNRQGIFSTRCNKKCHKNTGDAYAIAVIFTSKPDSIIAVLLNSSFAVEFGDNVCLGSDAGSLSDMCDEVAYFEGSDSVELSNAEVVFLYKNFTKVERSRVKIERTGLSVKKTVIHVIDTSC